MDCFAIIETSRREKYSYRFCVFRLGIFRGGPANCVDQQNDRRPSGAVVSGVPIQVERQTGVPVTSSFSIQIMYQRVFAIFLLLFACICYSQAPVNSPAPKVSDECGIKSIQTCLLHVAQDEWGIVKAPLALRDRDTPALAAFGASTTLALATDTDAMAQLGVNPSREDNANKYSNYVGLYAPPVALAAGFLLGTAKHDNHLQQTTILAEEAMVDSFILNTGLGYVIDRQTPNQGNGKGNIWPHGTATWPDGQSMPSDHSILAWSFAHVVASEYDGWATKTVVYSIAGSVSAARVIARKHFPSDVFVGAVLGYYIGGYVVRRRSTERSADNFSLAPVRTPNGTGIQLSYNFAHRERTPGIRSRSEME